MGTIILVFVITIIIITYVIIKTQPKKQNSNKKPLSEKSLKKIPNNQDNGQILYKKKGIKTFDLKGMYYRKLDPKVDSGVFSGTALIESNKHDTYAVAIYNSDKRLYGYIPKGNKRLSNSMQKWHNGEVPAWGHLRYMKSDDQWFGQVKLPIGYSDSEMEMFKSILNLNNLNQIQIDKKEKETEKYFEILERHKEIRNMLDNLNNPSELYYSFPRNLIPAISKHLEKEKNWAKLIELENYQDLIDDLTDTYREPTLRRISIAKQNDA
jgi:hypothetical protein